MLYFDCFRSPRIKTTSRGVLEILVLTADTGAPADIGAPAPAATASPAAGPPAAPRRWVPIRTLGRRHAPRVLEHLLSLSAEDRVRRFGLAIGDDMLRSYAEQIDYEKDEVFGIFNSRLKLVAMAHLAYLPAAEAGRSVEFGVSVSARNRGQGMASRLFDHAVIHARNRGVRDMVLHVARENTAMLRIVRRAGATVTLEGDEVMAQLSLAADTLGSQLEELLAHQTAAIDYRYKLRILQLDALRSVVG